MCGDERGLSCRNQIGLGLSGVSYSCQCVLDDDRAVWNTILAGLGAMKISARRGRPWLKSPNIQRADKKSSYVLLISNAAW